MAVMLFGRLRVPVERALAPEPRDRHESGFHVVASTGTHPLRDEASRAHHSAPVRPLSTRLSLVRLSPRDDEFAGLDRLDREELDEDEA